jgi:HAD superfamily hydrolase (TIGR01509 family)
MDSASTGGAARRRSRVAAQLQLQLVLFDVGGVLVDLGGVQEMLDWLGGQLTLEQLWRVWLRSPAVRRFETGRSEPLQFAHEVLHELQLSLDPQQFLDSFARWPRFAYPGALALAARIPSSYRCALLSNSNVLHWPRVVEEMGLGAVFAHRFASHLTGTIKPDADSFQYVLDALQVPAQAVLFLDDNALNVDAARALGLQAEQVRGPEQAERALLRAGIIDPASL